MARRSRQRRRPQHRCDESATRWRPSLSLLAGPGLAFTPKSELFCLSRHSPQVFFHFRYQPGYVDFFDCEPPAFRRRERQSQVLRWKKFDEVKELPFPSWQIETGGVAGGLLKHRNNSASAMRHERLRLFSGSVEFDDTTMIIGQLGGLWHYRNSRSQRLCWKGDFLDAEGNTFRIPGGCEREIRGEHIPICAARDCRRLGTA